MQFRESLKPNEAWDAFSIVPPSDDSQIRDAWVSFFHKVIEQYIFPAITSNFSYNYPNGVFPKWNRNSVNSGEADKSLKHELGSI